MAATGTPVRDMWLGPLGLMHRMAERGAWERTPDLGVETHVSLHGRVTASRALWSPRTTSLSWQRLLPQDADALVEMATVPAREDATIGVIDPDAAGGNLLTAEQSRGRPLRAASPDGVVDLYQLTGAGTLLIALAAGVRYAATQDLGAFASVTWLHPYHGARGWPVMPGWPVYLSHADIPGILGLAPMALLTLAFLDQAGAVVSSASSTAGEGQVSADAPTGAVTVAPSLTVSEAAAGIRTVGTARLTYAPQDAASPLGNGCPTYAITGVSDTPELPYRSTSLNLQEVRAYAAR